MRHSFTVVLLITLFLILPFFTISAGAEIKSAGKVPNNISPAQPGAPGAAALPAGAAKPPMPKVTQSTQPVEIIQKIVVEYRNCEKDLFSSIDASNSKRRSWLLGIWIALLVITWIYCDYSLRKITARGPSPRKMFWYMIFWLIPVNLVLSYFLSAGSKENFIELYPLVSSIICLIAVFLYVLMMVMTPKGRRA